MQNEIVGLKEKLLRDYDQSLNQDGINGSRVATRLEEISNIGLTSDGGSNRVGFSKEERQAKELVKKWMIELELEVKEDGAGNVFGRLNGINNEMPAILAGSHLDSVPNGGHFDGPLGVVAALEVVESWKETGYQPVRPFEVVIFSDEEGARFNGGLTGSEAMMGDVDVSHKLTLKDSKGLSFEEVLRADNLTLEGYQNSMRDHSEIGAFVEVHIEQGKLLEKENLPCGIVTGIAGPCWIEMIFEGKAGHAGNTPMFDRQDALIAASEFIFRLKELPTNISKSAVATVGKLNVYPNGVNVIPGKVQLYVDIRDIFEETRDTLVEEALKLASSIAKNHEIELTWKENTKIKPVPIKQEMQQMILSTMESLNIRPFFLPSGAGHDAMMVGKSIPVAMLFVQSKGGISHNPKEWSSLYDCLSAVHVLKGVVEKLVSK
ncbi:M20 family metallo-hydrolase [Litchfieldia alkalitelluris]|uniref:M20 family metallo-hydrolase n=1 Tax=Litchfieldia alkalitelluris TaxID=304268 RepID=UPI000997DB7E|nr:M20 family metallo-hydrolase [Litchfieldia alkalitelluris]